MTRMRRRLAAAASSFILTGASLAWAASPLAAAPAWTPAHQISGPATTGDPKAFLDGPGPFGGLSATSAWAAWAIGGVVHAAEHPAGAWAPAVPISAVGGGASGVEVARDVAAWQRSEGADTVVQAAIRTNGVWAPAENLSLPGADATDPSVTALTFGPPLVVWLRADGGGDAVVEAAVRSRDPGAGWGAPVPLSDPKADASQVQVAGRQSGAVALWRSMEDGESRIRASLFSDSTGTWSIPVAVSPAGQAASEPRVASTAQGAAAAVWVAGSGSGATIQASTLPAGSSEWSVPLAISGPGASAPSLAAAQDAGNPAMRGAIAAWQRADGAEQVVEAAIRPGDTGAWSIPVRLSPEGQKAETPVVAAGNAALYAAWRRPGDGGTAVMAATRPAEAGTWTGAKEVAPAGEAVEGLGLVEGNREALAVWRRAGGPVQGAAYDTLGPGFTDLEAPPSASPTSPFPNPPLNLPARFSLKPFDTWSAVAGVSWDFEAGGTKTGAGVEHTFTSTDTVIVRAFLTDALGNRTEVPHITVHPGTPDPPSIPVVPPERAAGSCALPAAPAPPRSGRKERIRLTRAQMVISQRIAQAALRRADAIERWLAAGIEARDLCGAAFGSAAFGDGVVVDNGSGGALVRPDPRPLEPSQAAVGDGESVTLSVAQLTINQRISQAALRRLGALEARLDAGLSGGDLRDGAVTAQKLALGLRIRGATPPAAPPARTATPSFVPKRTGEAGRVELTGAQLRINQRIAQAAIRRANALERRLMSGLDQSDFQPRTITFAKLHPALRG